MGCGNVYCSIQTHPVLCTVATIIACIGLQGIKVKDGVAAHKAFQLCGAEQMNSRATAQHHEAACKGLKLQHKAINPSARLVHTEQLGLLHLLGAGHIAAQPLPGIVEPCASALVCSALIHTLKAMTCRPAQLETSAWHNTHGVKHHQHTREYGAQQSWGMAHDVGNICS